MMIELKSVAPARRPSSRLQPDVAVGRLTDGARIERARAARARVLRDSHASFEPGPDPRDPISLLESQAVTQIPERVPVP